MIAGVDQGGDGEAAAGGLSREGNVRMPDVMEEGLIGRRSVIDCRWIRVLGSEPAALTPSRVLGDRATPATAQPSLTSSSMTARPKLRAPNTTALRCLASFSLIGLARFGRGVEPASSQWRG